jgi:hypothetical protein
MPQLAIANYSGRNLFTRSPLIAASVTERGFVLINSLKLSNGQIGLRFRILRCYFKKPRAKNIILHQATETW